MNQKYLAAYCTQMLGAQSRGIEFLLTFDQWLKIWNDSGSLEKRGSGKGQYCMGRIGDKGPYAEGNVKIITNRENSLEANKGRKRSAETLRRMSESHLGNTHSEETRQKLRQLALARSPSTPFHTEETKRKMSVSQKARFERAKNAAVGDF